MQVAAQDFCVVFICKKILKTYTWIDPTNRNQRFMQDMHSHCNNYLSKTCSWTITELYANNTQHMEDEYLRMRREGEHDPITVQFNDQVKEIYVSVQAVLITHLVSVADRH